MFVQPSDLMLGDLQMKGTQGQHQIPYSILKGKKKKKTTKKKKKVKEEAPPEPTATDN
jgi:hypothetical protein